MFGNVAHGGAAVFAAAAFGYLNRFRGVAPSHSNPPPGGNTGIVLGNPVETIAGVTGDYIDIIFNGVAWYVSGACAGTNATGGATNLHPLYSGTTIIWV